MFWLKSTSFKAIHWLIDSYSVSHSGRCLSVCLSVYPVCLSAYIFDCLSGSYFLEAGSQSVSQWFSYAFFWIPSLLYRCKIDTIYNYYYMLWQWSKSDVMNLFKTKPKDSQKVPERFVSSQLNIDQQLTVCVINNHFSDKMCSSCQLCTVSDMPSVDSGNLKNMITNSRDTTKTLRTWFKYCFT